MLKEQRRNQRQINLDGHSLRRFRKEMPAAQNAFDPPEKQFDGPAPAVNGSHDLRARAGHRQIGDQQQVLVPPARISTRRKRMLRLFSRAPRCTRA